MMNTTKLLPSPQEIPHDLIESQTNRVALLRRRFSRCQLEVSREESGRLQGWVTAGETREVELKGIPTYLNLKRAVQLFAQSYLKFQKDAIEVLPRGLGGMQCTDTGKEQVSPPSENDINSLIETIPHEVEREEIQRAVATLRKNDPAENHLDLSCFCSNCPIGVKGLQILGAFLPFNQSIQRLNLNYNQIGNEGAQALGEALKINQSLQALCLADNQIGKKGTQALGEALKVNQSLQALELSHNKIGNAGAQALGKALKVNQSLQFLDLSNNKISNMGVQSLGEALAFNRALEALYLSNNKIGNVGAQALEKALKVNQSLQELDLRNNNIGAEGAQLLGAALQVNQTLQSLNLINNQIGNDGAQALGEALQVNQSLLMLELSYNKIGKAGAQALEAALQINDTLRGLSFADDPNDEKSDIENRINTLLKENKKIATVFEEQIAQVQDFLELHENDDGIPLEYLPQLKELLSKWHTISNKLIPCLENIHKQSRQTNLNNQYRNIVTDLTNRLHNLWLEPFERKVAALSNEYVMGKESSEKRNVNLGHALYETWLIFLGSDCPNWAEDRLQSLLPFGVLLDVAEGGEKKDISELTDARSLFKRVLLFRDEFTRFLPAP